MSDRELTSYSRYEYKYVITEETAGHLRSALSPFIIADPYGDESGAYTVSSLYFDTKRNSYYYDTLNREFYRQKLRLRTYGEPREDSESFFELKLKYGSVSTKRRFPVPLRDALESIAAGTASFSGGLLREIAYCIESEKLVPASVVSYERQAFVAREEALDGALCDDLRVTFDRAIRVRRDDLSLLLGSHGEPTAPADTVVLEVKFNKCIPREIAETLSAFDLRKRSFSKYCSIHL